VLLRQVAEVAFAREAPQLADTAVTVDGVSERLRPLELCQILVALVDRLELESLLQTGEVEVVLLVELGDEPVGVLAVRIELGGSGRAARHRP
jgi:hypothetical protein